MVMIVNGPLVVAQEPEPAGDQTQETVDQEAAGEAALQAAGDRGFEGEITVTGSLIPRPTLEALSPVTVMEVPEELTYTGLTRIEDLLTSLPQVFAGQSSRIANGASGTATVNLRYLGTRRTLVLINGRRLAPGDAVGPWAPDINVVPASIVKRVDVLTGGASTVYGSDAMAGVVNFVLDTDFTGVRGGVQYSFFQHDNNNAWAQSINEAAGFDYPAGNIIDGDAINANIAIGGKFAGGKGHASAYIDYRNIDEMTLAHRDYTNCYIATDTPGPECGGSLTSALGTFIAFNANGSLNGYYTLSSAEDGGDGHSFRPWAGEVFNYNPYNHIQRPDEKWNAGAFVHYTLSDYFEPYVEVMLMSNYTDATIAPSGNFAVYNLINCDNPMLSEQQWNTICGPATGYGPTDLADVLILRRNVEGAGRTNQLGHTNLRLLAGLRGDINDQWSYDLYYLHAENKQQDSYVNDLDIGRVGNALDVIEDPDTGEWVCRVGGDCVPWNIFQEGAVTQEAIDYISTVAVRYGKTETEVVNLTFTTDWEDYGVVVPSASEGLQLAIGGEYRRERLRSVPDEIFQTGNAAGFGGAQPAVSGEFSVGELFVEALVPLIQNARGFRDLSLELGYRYSDYSTSGGFNTYKGLLNWAITDSWRLRGGYNRAVRAANIFELFTPTSFGLGGRNDICANDPETGVPPATLEQCLRTGVTEEQYGNILANPAGQYSTLGGGNPFLTPEVADTVTAGVVWTPQGIHGLSVTADYFNIEITETIWVLNADDIIQRCANTGDPQICSLIHRDEHGTLWLGGYTETTTQNVGLLNSEGIDLNVNYLIGLGDAGYLATDLVGTYLLATRIDSRVSDYDCVGYYGDQCGAPVSRWRHRARATWETNFNTNFSLAWRMVGAAEIDDASPNPDLGDPGQMELRRINGFDRHSAQHFFDLSATYTFRSGIQLAAGVNNIFDTEPPFPAWYWGGYNGTYDPFGRFIFTSLQFGF